MAFRARISSSTSAYFFFPTVSEPTMLPKAVPTAPTRAAAPPPPGVGALEASTSTNLRQDSLAHIHKSCSLCCHDFRPEEDQHRGKPAAGADVPAVSASSSRSYTTQADGVVHCAGICIANGRFRPPCRNSLRRGLSSRPPPGPNTRDHRRPRLLPAVDSGHQRTRAFGRTGRIFCRDQPTDAIGSVFSPYTGNIRKAQAAKPPAPNSSIYLEQAGDLAVLIHVDPLCSGDLAAGRAWS